MFITKLDRARTKMEEDFKNVTVDIGKLATLEEIESTFNEMCLDERRRLQLEQQHNVSPKDFTKFIQRPRVISRISTTEKRKRSEFSGEIGKTAIEAQSTQKATLIISPSSKITAGIPRAFSDIIAAGPDVLEMFGINLQYFCSLRGSDEKVKYVLKSMKEKIKRDMEEFHEALEKKKEEQLISEEQYKTLKRKNEVKNSKKDIFEWMKVPTSFVSLKKKLRQKIVETIGDGDNYLKLNGELQEKEKEKTQRRLMSTQAEEKEEKSEGGYHTLLNHSNTIDGVLLPSQRSRMKKTMNSESTLIGGRVETQKSEFNLVEEEKKLKISSVKFDNSSILEETNKFITNTKLRRKSHLRSAAEGQEQVKSDDFEKEKAMLEEMKQKAHDIDAVVNQVRGIPEKIEWNKEKDELFDEKRKQARHQLVYLCNSSSWNEVGFSKFINEIRFNDQNKNIRENLINRYMGGEWLTEAEIRYIAVTSDGLNRFLDREYFNNAIQLLDEEAIDDMEMKIAENIISQYRNIRKLVYDSRDQFLKEHSSKIRKEIYKEGRKTLLDLRQEKEKLERNRVILKRNVQKAKKKLTKIEEAKMKRRILDSVSKAKDVFMTKKKERDELQINELKKKGEKKEQNRKKRWREFLERNFAEMIQSTLYGAIELKEYKHKCHPSSKLIVGSNHGRNLDEDAFLNSDDTWKKRIYNKEEIQEMKFFKLASNDKESLKNREKFLDFYSLGPKNNGNTKSQGKPVKKLSKKTKEAAAICIQSNYRRFKAYLRVKKLKMKEEEKRLEEAIRKKEERNSFDPERASSSKNKMDLGRSIRVFAARKFLDRNQLLSPSQTQKGNLKSKTDFEDPIGGRLRPETIPNKEGLNPNSSGKPSIIILPPEHNDQSQEEQFSKEEVCSVQGELENDKGQLKDKGNQLKQGEQASKGKENGHRKNSITNLMKKRNENTTSPEKLLKNKQLLIHSKQGNLDKLKSLGFYYSQTDINVQDKYGNTPLHYSAKIGNAEICNWLLERGANPNTPGWKKNTPVHMAFLSQNPYVLFPFSNYFRINFFSFRL